MAKKRLAKPIDRSLEPVAYPAEKLLISKETFSLVVIFLAERFAGTMLHDSSTEAEEDDYYKRFDRLIEEFTNVGWHCLKKGI